MSSTPQITLYTANFSPYAHRVHIALEETGVKYTTYPIDIMTPHRPEWYSQVSPFGKVPAIAFGGPEVPPDRPSPDSAKLFESVALLEFLADLFPDNPYLLPKDLVKRAHARAFISIYQNYVNDLFKGVFFSGLPQTDALLDALAKLQGALPPEEGAFAVGAWSIADAAVAPFLARMWLYLGLGLGRYSEEDGQKMREAFAGERFARLSRYVRDLRARPSFQATWGGDELQTELGWNIPIFRRGGKPAA
ncbi:thioredoxin-like protein [Trametes elegans]|nr:thioredoxin-like protein [Trametes elegans]